MTALIVVISEYGYIVMRGAELSSSIAATKRYSRKDDGAHDLSIVSGATDGEVAWFHAPSCMPISRMIGAQN